MKAWAACNSLDWVTCFLLHFILAYIVYLESRTRQVVYIHVHYVVHGEMYIGIDSRLIDWSICCIICSQIKKIRVLEPELLISCHPNKWHSTVSVPRGPPCDLRIAQMSAQFSWSLRWVDWSLNAETESGCHSKSRGGGNLQKSAPCGLHVWNIY